MRLPPSELLCCPHKTPPAWKCCNNSSPCEKMCKGPKRGQARPTKHPELASVNSRLYIARVTQFAFVAAYRRQNASAGAQVNTTHKQMHSLTRISDFPGCTRASKMFWTSNLRSPEPIAMHPNVNMFLLTCLSLSTLRKAKNLSPSGCSVVKDRPFQSTLSAFRHVQNARIREAYFNVHTD
jgi:hypothetical protein